MPTVGMQQSRAAVKVFVIEPISTTVSRTKLLLPLMECASGIVSSTGIDGDLTFSFVLVEVLTPSLVPDEHTHVVKRP